LELASRVPALTLAGFGHVAPLPAGSILWCLELGVWSFIVSVMFCFIASASALCIRVALPNLDAS